MTVEEKVGQLFFVRCPEENAAEDVAQYHLGGMIPVSYTHLDVYKRQDLSRGCNADEVFKMAIITAGMA